MPLKPEQVSLRKKGVTASEVASIMGLSPWGSALEVWADKRGYAPPRVETEAMANGNAFEVPILNRMAEKHSLTIMKTGEEQETIVSGRNPLVIATPDGICIDQQQHPYAVAEAKCPGRYTGRHWIDPREDPTGIPIYYWPQVLWQMGALGLPGAWVAAYVFGDLYTYQIPFVREQYEMMEEYVVKWWHDYVLTDTPPPPQDNQASWDFINTYYDQTSTDLVEIDGDRSAEVDRWVEEYVHAKEQEKAASKAKKTAEAAIRQVIGTTAGVTTGSYKCTWKKGKDTEVLDKEALAKDVDLTKYQIKKAGRRYFFAKEIKNGE